MILRCCRPFAVLAGCFLAIGLGVAGAQDNDSSNTLHVVHFPPGKASTSIAGGFVRGEADTYEFTAEAGQAAEIRVASVETNADLMIYAPPSKLVHGDDGLDVTGDFLPGGDKVAGLDAGATRHWKGMLPATGKYYVVVTSNRGNVKYELSIAIE